MKFTPLEIKEVATNYLLPAGEYPVEILDADECISQNGNPQIKLKLRIVGDGQSVTTFDYLGAESKKLRNFCINMGLSEKYKAGEISDVDCLNKSGHASVKIERSSEYGDKNKIAFYITKQPAAFKPEPKASAPDFEDDIPF